MRAILITGADGQLAQSLKSIDKKICDYKIIYTNSKNLDITKFSQIEKIFKENDIEWCVNCAAYTAVDKAEVETEKANNINILGVKNLVSICKQGQTKLIHISTDFVFDGNSNIPYKEVDKTNPINTYGLTKVKGELEITQNLFRYYIIRTSWLYSEKGNNFLKTMLKLAQDKKEFNVVSDQIGTPTYAKDLANVIFKIINVNNDFYGIYHYSNEGVTSWYDFAKTIFEIREIDIKVIPIKTENYFTSAKRPKYSILDKSKIKKQFKIKIPHWKESLTLAIKNL